MFNSNHLSAKQVLIFAFRFAKKLNKTDFGLITLENLIKQFFCALSKKLFYLILSSPSEARQSLRSSLYFLTAALRVNWVLRNV